MRDVTTTNHIEVKPGKTDEFLGLLKELVVSSSPKSHEEAYRTGGFK